MLDGDFIRDERKVDMTLELFEEPFMYDRLGGKGACINITLPTNEVCNHV